MMCRLRGAAVLLAAMLGGDPAFPQVCADGRSPDELLTLAWRDHGPNPGAACGLRALAGARVAGYAGALGQRIAGEPWDASAMMHLAIRAYRSRQPDVAMAVALCAQVPDRAAIACLSESRFAVIGWFEKRLGERPPRPAWLPEPRPVVAHQEP